MIEIIWIHFFADFIAQTDKMAINKSTSIKWLSFHCLVYSFFFLGYGIKIAILVGITHFIVDFITSKITKYLWEKDQRHWFFTIIGLDQAIHLTILFYLIGF